MIQSVDITPGLEVKNYIEEDNISEKKKTNKKQCLQLFCLISNIQKLPRV